MATKLKKPIILVIDYVEQAVALAKTGGPLPSSKFPHSIFRVLEAGLSDQGIDYGAWEPPQPFLIAGHEPEFRADGSVKVGCQEIAAKDVEEFIKRRQEARKEPEWPTYYVAPSTSGTYRHRSSDECLQMWATTSHKWFDAGHLSAYKPSELRPITRAEAAAIVGEANL